MSAKKFVGLDFGTTNSAIAIADSDGSSDLTAFPDGDDLTTVLIDEVRPASAAAKAGIAESDVIVSINGRSGTTLQEVRKLFRTAGEYELVLNHSGKVVNVRLILKRVI
jgi:S1-C subfamily serine protease